MSVLFSSNYSGTNSFLYIGVYYYNFSTREAYWIDIWLNTFSFREDKVKCKRYVCENSNHWGRYYLQKLRCLWPPCWNMVAKDTRNSLAAKHSNVSASLGFQSFLMVGWSCSTSSLCQWLLFKPFHYLQGVLMKKRGRHNRHPTSLHCPAP